MKENTSFILSYLNRKTCLQTDWSKTGVGYLLLQKYCECPDENTPVYCTNGQKLVFAGSRFTNPTESQYSPTERDALAFACSLENARMFVLGCKDLTIATDHKPLLGIFNNRKSVLSLLHSGHQGITSMRSRANKSVY